MRRSSPLWYRYASLTSSARSFLTLFGLPSDGDGSRFRYSRDMDGWRPFLQECWVLSLTNEKLNLGWFGASIGGYNKHRHWMASWVIHLKRRCTWKMPKKPSNDVFVQTCLGKTKPHSCLGFQESTNAQWLISVDLTSQRLKSCFHMPRDRSVRSHLDDWHQGHRSQSGPVQVKSRRIQSTRTGTPMCCNASTCLQHATRPRVKNPPAVYVILNHVPQENWDSHLGFLNISALGSHKQIGLMFYQFAARVCSQFIHGEVHGLTWQAGKTHARTGRPWNFAFHLKCISIHA